MSRRTIQVIEALAELKRLGYARKDWSVRAPYDWKAQGYDVAHAFPRTSRAFTDGAWIEEAARQLSRIGASVFLYRGSDGRLRFGMARFDGKSIIRVIE